MYRYAVLRRIQFQYVFHSPKNYGGGGVFRSESYLKKANKVVVSDFSDFNSTSWFGKVRNIWLEILNSPLESPLTFMFPFFGLPICVHCVSRPMRFSLVQVRENITLVCAFVNSWPQEERVSLKNRCKQKMFFPLVLSQIHLQVTLDITELSVTSGAYRTPERAPNRTDTIIDWDENMIWRNFPLSGFAKNILACMPKPQYQVRSDYLKTSCCRTKWWRKGQ